MWLAAVPALAQEKGGEDETGAYEVVANWPQPWSPAGYIWGSQPAVFAQSPDRVFIGVRGEIKAPNPAPRGFNGSWGSTGQRATEPPAETRNCLVVVNRSGHVIESWTQWDKLFEGGGSPHKIRSARTIPTSTSGSSTTASTSSTSSRTTASSW